MHFRITLSFSYVEYLYVKARKRLFFSWV